MKSSLPKIILFLFLLLISFLVSLEITLRALGLILAENRLIENITNNKKIIFTVGDSHTYGVQIASSDSYPSQLNKLLGDEYLILNLGIPGQNTSQMVELVKNYSKKIKPETVIFLGGINNQWNRAKIFDNDDDGKRIFSLWDLKIFKLWNLAKFNFANRKTTSEVRAKIQKQFSDGVPSDYELGGEKIKHLDGRESNKIKNKEGITADQDFFEKITQRDLKRLKKLSDKENFRLILMTYPVCETPFSIFNKIILDFSKKESVELIDNCQFFKNEDLTKLLLPDLHLNELGYKVLSQNIYNLLNPK